MRRLDEDISQTLGPLGSPEELPPGTQRIVISRMVDRVLSAFLGKGMVNIDVHRLFRDGIKNFAT